jgi:membrane-associated phospholipid phosphatase
VFSALDSSISQPYHDDTVSITTVVLVGILLPLLSFIAHAIYLGVKRPAARSAAIAYAYEWAWLLLLVWLSEVIITEMIKVLSQRYRPDFVARCFYNANMTIPDALLVNNPRMMLSTSQCTNTDSNMLDDGRKSFPSGHTSAAFASMTVQSLFVINALVRIVTAQPQSAAQGGANSRSGLWDYLWQMSVDRNAVLSVLVFAPQLWAFAVGASRMLDNKHYPLDVICGLILGAGCALVIYRMKLPQFDRIVRSSGEYTICALTVQPLAEKEDSHDRSVEHALLAPERPPADLMHVTVVHRAADAGSAADDKPSTATSAV